MGPEILNFVSCGVIGKKYLMESQFNRNFQGVYESSNLCKASGKVSQNQKMFKRTFIKNLLTVWSQWELPVSDVLGYEIYECWAEKIRFPPLGAIDHIKEGKERSSRGLRKKPKKSLGYAKKQNK